MKVLSLGRTAAVLSASALALAACGSDNATGAAAGTDAAASASTASGTLTGAGASSQSAAMDAWIAGFNSANPTASVQYSPDGSGAGREALLAGGVQFAGTDAYLSDEEAASSLEVCGPDGALHIPAYISPIAIAFNLEAVEELNLDADTLAGIFRGEITVWNDPAITGQNEGTELPATAITVVHRSDESGTTENFTEFLAAAAPSVWTDEPDGEWPAALSGQENAQGTSGVVSAASATEGAITYADASAVGTMGTVAVKVGDDYVAYTPDAAAKAVEASTPVEGEGRPELDMAMELARDTTESGAYPVVLVSYHLYCTAYEDQETVDLVKAFGHYVVSAEGQAAAADAAGNAPLSANLQEQASKALDSIKVAS
ncbi:MULTISPECIES: phosphate ABC transporter substrate-binding protein PstS [Arthrobacter]|uniref:Phosphate-binding protein n=1 Tax=Arthrobacter caoxuetaonis TaxID=2886935 RepID=A0A9X1MFH3_9MICC|nr:phosphate ABC transporter substrate-binding protein PstS [Arthrobacter caoxuetaonis]MCC3281665.1 phosphate ABC transporter substrate-binding protein PstS [Arthrobacter caoxuetaonis]MCC3298666.1 phosphate ABC transporter substrate-binding protein PstS [Arthrobacter caoxuetaonis]MCC9194892.1 phosphate ABC transporter substrate-binding protein PstS [Arthrobacter sp. zg-Y916]USQ57403.1 phosphate ABC transporter substrate-binding protein PstS [Arthrobacter caoxuetaonis]